MPGLVTRFSVSLPEELLDRLDAVVNVRGLPSRSHAIAEMIQQYLLDHQEAQGDQLVAGVITVVYTNERQQLRGKLHDIQRRYLKEVISSQHVFLEDDQSLEALLVQGPGETLQALVDELTACKGVSTVKLAITAALLPPIHGTNGKNPAG